MTPDSTPNPDWTPNPGRIAHRRGDGELLGWMLPRDEGFVVIDLLGREVSAVLDWLAAEETLETLGLGYLAEPFELAMDDGSWLRVRIVEVSGDTVRVKKDDWGAIDAPALHYTVSFPIAARLRPFTGDPGVIHLP